MFIRVSCGLVPFQVFLRTVPGQGPVRSDIFKDEGRNALLGGTVRLQVNLQHDWMTIFRTFEDLWLPKLGYCWLPLALLIDCYNM